ncbi:hypothetical protein F9C07_2278845 [Aspergillus flavus]|uniref:Uncharacterized protein n=1 Tax=Aspergillus flavus (strain ATCC 200026 / FGSC A1120 / IAM 13836 / NRRL 3357 / JCM 12722 / SRRC 167) TaxID=332952 RepID=A0A7U2MPG0_ASPFN|nr:hypothetical protein F9C07_2278845 [Aspergillus flavus]
MYIEVYPHITDYNRGHPSHEGYGHDRSIQLRCHHEAGGDAKRKDIERKLLVQKIEADNSKLGDLVIFSGVQPSIIETILKEPSSCRTRSACTVLPFHFNTKPVTVLHLQNNRGSQ